MAEENSKLHDAAEMGNLENLEEALSSGININSTVDRGEKLPKVTALHIAAYYRKEEIVDALIARGADVNAVDGKGRTPAYLASTKGNANVIMSLFHVGADLNLPDEEFGDTPLSIATRKSNEFAVHSLIQCGVNVNARDHNGTAPIHIAAKTGNRLSVQKLIDAGADINARDKEGRMPLDFAIANQHPEVQEILTRAGGLKRGVDVQTKRFGCVLMMAIGILTMFGSVSLAISVFGG